MGDQSRINIASTDNSSNVIEKTTLLEKLEHEITKHSKEDNRETMLSLVKEIRKLGNTSKEKEKARSHLAEILSRAANVAQIGSLVAQIMPFFI